MMNIKEHDLSQQTHAIYENESSMILVPGGHIQSEQRRNEYQRVRLIPTSIYHL